MNPARIVGVDYGKKRVGVAVSDPLRLFAQPYGTFKPSEVLEELVQLRDREGIEVIVIGWPLTLEGEEGDATAFVASFIKRLRKVLPGVPVVKQDERFTSEMAKDAIRAAGAKRKARRNKERVDAAAAAIILQQYLEEQ